MVSGINQSSDIEAQADLATARLNLFYSTIFGYAASLITAQAKFDRDNAITELENAVRDTQNLTRFGLTKTVIRDLTIDMNDTDDGSGEVDESANEVATSIAI
ncbi:hypothetical protein Ddc_19649 [Ditylenchus destructor]|nr:hypothetical protein Ddc_19649 [Ditylenchus destructor]